MRGRTHQMVDWVWGELETWWPGLYGGSPSVDSPNLSPAYMCCLSNDVSIFCVFVLFVCLPLWLTDANTPKKCRALFGLDQLSLWCKPCRYTPVVSMGGQPYRQPLPSLTSSQDIPRKYMYYVFFNVLIDGLLLSVPFPDCGFFCYSFSKQVILLIFFEN